MYIQIVLKHPGNLKKKVTAQPFYLADTPATFGALIAEAVRTSCEAYLSRDDRKDAFRPLDDEQMAGMGEVGKFAWCLPVETRAVTYDDALCVAKEAITDGLVRVFQNDRELTDFDEKIEIGEGDVFTFVRLTMLTGRMW